LRAYEEVLTKPLRRRESASQHPFERHLSRPNPRWLAATNTTGGAGSRVMDDYRKLRSECKEVADHSARARRGNDRALPVNRARSARSGAWIGLDGEDFDKRSDEFGGSGYRLRW